ncbi:CAP domain-containing protein [Natrialbaceae archaeon AArc-T1-2]|uniref:CAP domain-containing protein n=1 Tax=Natrialbaceae archaeon AArc-T1-2 TaxID=3053904 RepID=UPI00255B2ADE|nr:CAP domain-containing protein [Natrialbaceae archaeon AArc-T1-2]WIV67884.1 CAP domain-containing protein [Natrialbaceae archaeon AArc-T1-2]
MPGPRRVDAPSAASSDGSGPVRAVARVLFAILRMLVVAVVLAALVAGAVLVGPGLIDDLEDRTGPVGFEDPPPAGDRDPDRVDPADPGESTYEAAGGTVSSAAVEDYVHHEVNDRRAERGLDPIEWDGTIASVSRAHSADMHERAYFEHTNPDGEDPMDRFTDVAGYCRAYGENIAMTHLERPIAQPDGGTTRHETPEQLAAGLVDQWMNSPPHREAILEASWDRGGVGIYLTEDGQVFATHNFCETP